MAASGNLGSGGTVTGVNASSGAPVRVIAGESYQFGSPVALATDANHLFVADRSIGGQVRPNSVTELNPSTGTLNKGARRGRILTLVYVVVERRSRVVSCRSSDSAWTNSGLEPIPFS